MRKLMINKLTVDGNGYIKASGKLIIDIEVGMNGYHKISDLNTDTIAAICVGTIKATDMSNVEIEYEPVSVPKDIVVYMNDENTITNDQAE